MNVSYTNKLNKRITIQQRTGSASSMIDTETWTTFKTVYAGVDPLQGKQYFEANRENSEVSVRVYIRYLKGINHAMRILYGSRVFEIVSIIDINEKHEQMHLMCKEVL